MSGKTAREQLKAYGLSKALGMLRSDPEKNLPRLMDWADRLDKDNSLPSQRRYIREAIENRDSNWNKLIMSLWTDIDDGVRAKFFENFIVNAGLIGYARQEKARAEQGCNIPWAILMDPTSACNLSCTGCWAAEYGDRMSMSFETLDSIIEQGKELGTFMYIYSGGEPLVRKKDIIRLCEKHSDCMFLAFTNGTLIDEEFADEMLRVKNFAPAISIEGFREETDARRGDGVYDKALCAMELLRERKLIFGASCCYTSQNTEVIGSGEYLDYLISLGCKYVWYFTFMPVGAGTSTELIASAEQRAYMYRQVREFRSTKPVFTMDFWNDGEFVKGCIAGGRYYCHINANGDIEPCAFIHYSDSSIYEKTLIEAFKSPLFMQYRDNQPFNSNHLRPCPLLDNHGKLAEMVHASGARSTDLSSPEDVDRLCDKCKKASERWAPVADALWNPNRDKAV